MADNKYLSKNDDNAPDHEDDSEDEEDEDEDEEDEEDEEEEEEDEDDEGDPLLQQDTEMSVESLQRALIVSFVLVPIVCVSYTTNLMNYLKDEENAFSVFKDQVHQRSIASHLTYEFSLLHLAYTDRILSGPDANPLNDTTTPHLLTLESAQVPTRTRTAAHKARIELETWLRQAASDTDLSAAMLSYEQSIAEGIDSTRPGELHNTFFTTLEGYMQDVDLEHLQPVVLKANTDLLTIQLEIKKLGTLLSVIEADFYAYLRTGEDKHLADMNSIIAEANTLLGLVSNFSQSLTDVTLLDTAVLVTNLSKIETALHDWVYNDAPASLTRRQDAGPATATKAEPKDILEMFSHCRENPQSAANTAASLAALFDDLTDAASIDAPGRADSYTILYGVLLVVGMCLIATLIVAHAMLYPTMPTKNRTTLLVAGVCLVIQLTTVWSAGSDMLDTFSDGFKNTQQRGVYVTRIDHLLSHVVNARLQTPMLLLANDTVGLEGALNQLRLAEGALQGETSKLQSAERGELQVLFSSVSADIREWEQHFADSWDVIKQRKEHVYQRSVNTTARFEALTAEFTSQGWTFPSRVVYKAVCDYLDHRKYLPFRLQTYSCEVTDTEGYEYCHSDEHQYSGCSKVTNSTMCRWNKICAWQEGQCVNSVSEFATVLLNYCKEEARLVARALSYLLSGEATAKAKYLESQKNLLSRDAFHTMTGQSLSSTIEKMIAQPWGAQTAPTVGLVASYYRTDLQTLNHTFLVKSAYLMEQRDVLANATLFPSGALASSPLFDKIVQGALQARNVSLSYQEANYEDIEHSVFRKHNTVTWMTVSTCWGLTVLLVLVIKELHLYVFW